VKNAKRRLDTCVRLQDLLIFTCCLERRNRMKGSDKDFNNREFEVGGPRFRGGWTKKSASASDDSRWMDQEVSFCKRQFEVAGPRSQLLQATIRGGWTKKSASASDNSRWMDQEVSFCKRQFEVDGPIFQVSRPCDQGASMLFAMVCPRMSRFVLTASLRVVT
jgi:hypothetical protein